MAAPKGRGLGKGLDSMIPNLVGEAKAKEMKSQVETRPVKEEKGPILEKKFKDAKRK